MDKTKNQTAAEKTEGSEGMTTSPYQRIVIASPDNHIIVVKRFNNGGEKWGVLRANEVVKLCLLNILSINNNRQSCELSTWQNKKLKLVTWRGFQRTWPQWFELCTNLRGQEENYKQDHKIAKLSSCYMHDDSSGVSPTTQVKTALHSITNRSSDSACQ